MDAEARRRAELIDELRAKVVVDSKYKFLTCANHDETVALLAELDTVTQAVRATSEALEVTAKEAIKYQDALKELGPLHESHCHYKREVASLLTERDAHGH